LGHEEEDPVEVLLRIHAHSAAHPKDETLEEYARGRLPDADAAPLEEHLLICEACQDGLRDIDEYTLAMKTGLAEYASRPKTPFAASIRMWAQACRSLVPGKPLSVAIWTTSVSTTAIWATALGLIFSAGLLAVSLLWRTDPRTPATTVALAAFRGGAGETMAKGPARRPLELSIDIGELSAYPGYRVEVVTSTGRHMWSGVAQPLGGGLTAHIETGLRGGLYWVRLYSANGELLREFGLRIG
jgi:anti-sigma factor RsiW